MEYGYFDEQNREYVITRPDTPAPWANYLGSPEYGALISNNAGGYSFVRSGANGRLLRYRFDGSDRPGRYIYLRDDADGDFWSASWQPVGKPLSEYSCECRHGLGYTRITADYRGIHSDAVWYVPLEGDWEVWHVQVRNASAAQRHLTVTGYAEFTNNSNYEQDTVNLQYSRYISRTFFEDNLVMQRIHGNLDAMPSSAEDDNAMEERFFGLAGCQAASWCGDRDVFLGNYHDYRNPQGAQRGDLGNTGCYNEYPCGAIAGKLCLEPGQTAELTFVLGRKNRAEAAKILQRYEGDAGCGSAGHGEAGQGNKGFGVAGRGDAPNGRIGQELEQLRTYWEEKLSNFQVKTPCPQFDTMINTWNAYNCFMTFIWSRAASFTYCGLRNGYGYRDTVQDIQGVIHLAPEMAAEKIRFMLSAQVDNGAGLPLVKFTHDPGHEDTPDDASYVKATGHPAYRADDALWLFPTVYKYIAETGDTAFLDEVIPYANRGEACVYDHLKQAIAFSMEHLGPHGMPAGLYADWNDCLRLGKNGESSFVAFQFYYAMSIMRLFAQQKKDPDYIAILDAEQKKLGAILQRMCWDEDRFIRGFTEEGAVIGGRDAREANLWLNPQSWSVISGFADAQQCEAAMGQVYDRLNTEYGAILMDPPYHADAFPGALAVIYNAGTKENAGIFSQSQGWLVLAEALLGHGERAFMYWSENAPSMQNGQADIRRLEPYCYGQFTEGKASPHFGRSHVHWLTGTASTMMVGSVEGILGMRPDLDGLKIAPAIPAQWEHLEITKWFRGSRLHIRIENPQHVQSGCRSMTLNGQRLEGNYIPASMLAEENEILLVL